jgi:hypothetical protein
MSVTDLTSRIKQRVTVEDRGHDTPCWISNRAQTTNGYTKIWVDGYFLLTHRLAYQEFVGPIPDGLQIDHLCRQRACCNPDHLEPVTPQENIRRAPWAQVMVCINGHEFSPANTRVNARGDRACKACDRDRAREYRARRRHAA